jgi:hypothetical protein
MLVLIGRLGGDVRVTWEEMRVAAGQSMWVVDRTEIDEEAFRLRLRPQLHSVKDH